MLETPPLATDAGQNATQRAQAQAIAEVDHVLANAKKELDVLLKTSTPPTKAIATVLVASYLLFLVMPWTSTYLALMPEKTVPCVWNVLTSGFYEMNLVGPRSTCSACSTSDARSSPSGAPGS